MQARFYAPWYGRFLSPDPARDQHFEETQSWNIYSYVQNNPTMKIDPNGEAGLLAELKEWVFGKSQAYSRDAPVNSQPNPKQSQATYSVTERWDNKTVKTSVTTGDGGEASLAGMKGTGRGTVGYDKKEEISSTFLGGHLSLNVERTSSEGKIEGQVGVSGNKDGVKVGIGAEATAASTGAGASVSVKAFGYELTLVGVHADLKGGTIGGTATVGATKKDGLSAAASASFVVGGKASVSGLGVKKIEDAPKN